MSFVEQSGETPGQRRGVLAAITFLGSLACLFLFAGINGVSVYFFPQLVSGDIAVWPPLDKYSSYVSANILAREPFSGGLGAYCILTQSCYSLEVGLIFGLSLSIGLMFLWALVFHILVGYIVMARERVIEVEFFRRRVLPAGVAFTLIAGTVFVLLAVFLIDDSASVLLFSAFFSVFSLLAVFLAGLPLWVGLLVLRLRHRRQGMGQRWR